MVGSNFKTQAFLLCKSPYLVQIQENMDRKYLSLKTATTCIFSTVNLKLQNLNSAANHKTYIWSA